VIAAGERRDPETGQRRPFAYVAVVISPPPENPAAPTGDKKSLPLPGGRPNQALQQTAGHDGVS
jgi:hypothetical protein